MEKFPILRHDCAAWSSPSRRNSIDLIYARVMRASFLDLFELVNLHGYQTVLSAMEEVKSEMNPKQYSMQISMLESIGDACA